MLDTVHGFRDIVVKESYCPYSYSVYILLEKRKEKQNKYIMETNISDSYNCLKIYVCNKV